MQRAPVSVQCLSPVVSGCRCSDANGDGDGRGDGGGDSDVSESTAVCVTNDYNIFYYQRTTITKPLPFTLQAHLVVCFSRR